LKHIKKDNKYVCKVCAKEFTHSSFLKKHIIREHQEKELIKKKVPVDIVMAPI
jgi:hypothetical protein